MATAVNNGVNVGALLEAREALRKAPEAAKFTWRATCKWKNGTHSRTLISNFFGLGAEQKHRTEFTFEADHPEIFASEDCGATPVELVLAGLASCLTAGVAAVAQNRGIQLRSVEAKLEGSMDIQGILGIDSDVRNGYDDIKVDVRHRCRRVAERHRGARRAVAEALGRVRHRHEPDERLGRGPQEALIAPARSGALADRTRHDRRHRRGAYRACGEPHAHRALDRARRARARRGRELLAPRALGFAAPAHAELAEPAAGLSRTHGADPDGFMTMREVVEFIGGFARGIDAPVRTHTEVTRVRPVDDGYRVVTSQGELRLPQPRDRERRVQRARRAGAARSRARLDRVRHAVRLPQSETLARGRRARRRRVRDRRAARRRDPALRPARAALGRRARAVAAHVSRPRRALVDGGVAAFGTSATTRSTTSSARASCRRRSSSARRSARRSI